MKNGNKKILIISNGPVPTPEHAKVEGGGLRCWGLAKGLWANSKELSITVAYHESYASEKFTKEYEGIKIDIWNIENVGLMIQEYDSVIVSYCMGDLSVEVANNIRLDQQLILDCYVPIYVEVSARQSTDLEKEYSVFYEDVNKWDQVLRRGDIFLCASEIQKRYYQGVLSALGRINPLTYNQENILVVPYGIYREEPIARNKPITELMKNESIKKVLWFGGIYPWFDLRELVQAVQVVNKKIPMRLIIVGAKNPFNNHPDFNKKYDELLSFIDAKNLKDLVKLQDWVKFEDRADWYLDSDVVVVINKVGDENELAWRTRLVDFAWSELPILTNGGDPLGEKLISEGAAQRLNGFESEDIAKGLIEIFQKPESIEKLKHNLKKAKKELYWDVVTKKLLPYIEHHFKPADLAEGRQFDIAQNPPNQKHPVRGALYKAKMVPAYARKHGVKLTYLTIKSAVDRRTKKLIKGSEKPKIHFIAHQLDISGAPFVFIDLVKEVVKTIPRTEIDFHTFNPIHIDNVKSLNKIGIQPKIYLNKEASPPFNKGDVVVLNTVAHSMPLKENIFIALERGIIAHLIWYVHEDEPELIFNERERQIIKRLLEKNKVTIYSAAKKTTENYREYFSNTKHIKSQIYKFKIPEKFRRVLSPNDFNKLSFCLPGAVADGRKGQLPVFYAFKLFIEKYYTVNPELYREFELVYIGLSDDFLSRQIMLHSKTLGNRFKSHGKVSHEKCLEIVRKSNITVCYSMRECLPLFVFEGMGAGHPILRNDSSGIDEQLKEGINGYMLRTDDFDHMVKVIEAVLNKTKTSNKELAAMSIESNKIALTQEHNSYDSIVSCIASSFNARG